MAESRSVLRVFLASPSDLERERHVIRAVASELNTSLARRLGFHVELMGWEDTLPGFGRPQEIINQDLEQCEFFIGLLWERWGSQTGEYSSGFEEEYEIAISSREQDGSPDIVIYLKDIDPLREKDAGPQLQQVLNFRKRLISERKVLFDNFANESDIESKVRVVLTDKLLKLWKGDSEAEQKSGSQSEDRKKVGEEEEESRKSALYKEEIDFLRTVGGLGDHGLADSFDRLSIARMRLLGCALWTEGNDRTTIGPHDANIIFLNRRTLDLSSREVVALIDAGLVHLDHENTPLWHWLLGGDTFDGSWLPWCTLGAGGEEQAAAIDAMRIIRQPLPLSGRLEREAFLERWLGDDQKQDVKVAAIQYLSVMGNSDDIVTLLDEVKKSDYRTVSVAKEAVLKLALADSRTKAMNLLLMEGMVSINEPTLDLVFNDGTGVDSGILVSCLEHRDSSVRMRAAQILRQRQEISAPIAKALMSDEAAPVRLQALLSQLENGQSLSLQDARILLIRRTGGGLFSLGTITGEEQFDAYRERHYLAMSEQQLLAEVRDDPLHKYDAFMALCQKKYSKYDSQLIAFVEKQFNNWIDSAIAQKMTLPGGEESASKENSLREFVSIDATRMGVNILCQLGNGKVLSLLRRKITALKIPLTPQIADYFKNFGEWDDISVIASAASRPDDRRRRASLLGAYNQYQPNAAQAIYQIGKERLPDVVRLPLNENLVAQVIALCTVSTFRQLSDHEVLSFLRDEREEVRRVTALKAIAHFPKKRVRSLLATYTSGEGAHYYNSVFWLDLLASWNKASASRTASDALRDMGRGWSRRFK